MPKRILEGKVVSDKQDKTVTVLVERRYMHPVYKKYIKRTDKYAAHDESNSIEVGAMVQIEECRPISKRKAWTVITGGNPDVVNVPKSAMKKEEAPKAEKKTATKKSAAKKAPAKAKTETKKDDKKKA